MILIFKWINAEERNRADKEKLKQSKLLLLKQINDKEDSLLETFKPKLKDCPKILDLALAKGFGQANPLV